MSRKKTHLEFVQEIQIKHPSLKVVENYINNLTKILVEDELGIQYKILPNDLSSGVKPSIQSATHKNKAFEIKAQQIHGIISYDYSNIEYKTNRDKIKILCKICNVHFMQRPTRHLSGDGCPICGLIKAQSDNQKTLKERSITIIDDITQIHNNRINCDKLIYQGNKKKSLFGCNVNPEHGYWLATPNDILDGCGCPSCNSSKGEIKVAEVLTNKNITFIREKKFHECRDKRVLEFDFYLPDHNLCIEYDGEGHFNSIPYLGGDKALEGAQRRDAIKNKFCKDNKIQLLRIPYTKFNEIEKIIHNQVVASNLNSPPL